jgi:hypothetical protein
MLQVVRRQTSVFSSSFASRAMPSVRRKERYLEIAFITLASANLFVISSAVAFYFLTHKH